MLIMTAFGLLNVSVFDNLQMVAFDSLYIMETKGKKEWEVTSQL